MKSPELTEFFSLLGKAKKEKKEEFDNLLKEADINLDVLTSTVVSGIKEAKVNIKKQKKKEEKLIEQLDSIIDVIENPKEVKDITEPAVTVGVPEDFDVSTLEIEDADDNPSFEVVDIVKPEPIKTPKISDTVAQAIKFIEETNLKEEIENEDETSVDNLKAEIKQVRDILYKVLAHGPGSGEVNLLKLDDVDEDSAKVDGKFLKYQSSTGKFVGADASGGGGGGSGDIAGISTTGTSVFNQINASGITSSTKVHVGVDTGVYDEDLVVTGNARVTGILTIGTGSIVLDPTAKQLRGLEEIVIGIANTITIKQDDRGEIEFTDAVGTPKSVGIGTTVSINTSGIITATTFVGGFTGDLTGTAQSAVTATNALTLGELSGSHYLNYNNFTNTPTIPSNNNQLTNGAGYITTSFTNTNQLTNGAGFITASDIVNTTGVITASQFSGFSHLIAPYASTKTITVKVASKIDGEHRYYGTGSGQGYILDNVQSPFLTLTPGRTYRFDVSDSSNSGHPFRFYLDAAKATAYTTGVTVGSGYVDLEVTDSTPTVLHYQCSSHGYMGNAIQVSSSNAIKLNSQAASYYLDYDNFTNTPTIPTNNNQLTNGAGYITTSFTSYNQLSDTPTIPSNNNQLTNGAGYITTSFTSYNQLSDTPTIPTNNNQLTNGAGYITTSFTNTNQLTNGAGFITASDDITGNAASATILENARTIGGVSFNGSANIDLPGVNSAGNQNTTGTSAGLTGTPNITVGSIVASTGTFSGNVTIGGTLSYEDVTNIDAVGIITANSGIIVGTGITLSKDGDGFFTGVTTATTFVGSLTGTASNATQLNSQAASFYLNYNNFSNTPTIPTNNNQLTNGAGYITTSFTNTNQLTNGAGFIDGSALNASNLSSGTIPDARFPSTLPAIDGSALTGIGGTANVRTGILDVAGIATFRSNTLVGSGITLSPDGNAFHTGVVTATSFVGDGSALTNLPSGSSDSISEGNTKAEVSDTGSNGKFFVETEGTERFSIERTGDFRFDTASDNVINANGNLTIDFDMSNSTKVRWIVGVADTKLYLQGGEDYPLNIWGAGDATKDIKLFRSGDVTVGSAIKLNGPSGIITATKFVGDGSELTNLPSSGIGANGSVNTTGIITASAFVGDGSQLTNVGSVGSASTANVRTGILDVAGIATFRSNTLVGSGITLSPDGDGFYTGIVTATSFVGDGSGLTNLPSGGGATDKIEEGNTKAEVEDTGSTGRFFVETEGTERFSVDKDGDFKFNTAGDNEINANGNLDIDFKMYNSNKLRFLVRTNQIILYLQPGEDYPLTIWGAGDATKDINFFRSGDVTVGTTIKLNGPSGIITATKFVGDGSELTGLSGGVAGISTTGTSVFNNINSSGVVTASSGVDLGDPGIVTLSSDTLTTTSTSADTVASVSATVNRSATFQVQVTRGTQYHMTTINVIHDGTNAFLSEYGTIRTGEILATFDADISGGNLRLRATPTSTASTVFKLSKTVIKV